MSCAASLVVASSAREVRKTVSVVFCDVVGSTALGESVDPEVLRALLARYFVRMSGIMESHGGRVDKFIGDAVMAVFGVPQAHEDDALRACRAAVEMRDALPELGLRGRIGVNTGEVVTGTAERLVTGDAVNVAARFEQAASPGEVLIGETTQALVYGAVVAEPVEPLELKGKSEPMPAFRLVSVLNAVERSHLSRFVGRESELSLIGEAWRRAQAQSGCELLTVVGDAGVGKSRLVAEAFATGEARVVRGRCLPYGEGITYWPVVEVIKQLGVLPVDPAAAAAIRSLLGESNLGTSGDEIAWAFRKLLEQQAPLVCVFDDVQWGEETFLDLIESTALLSTGAPLLLLCMARPELLERRPAWPATLRLEPLPPQQADIMIGDDVTPELRERIARAAGGNPLFISEMLAMAADNAEVEVPPTLRALLAMRLDQLDEAERRVLERGSVEGEIFHRGAVQALAPEEQQVTTRLAALVRHQLVRPERAQITGDDGYRFRHLLIRDTAYDALPKTVRADLHQRFANWLDQHGQELVERDEIVGYHLEQAARLRHELGESDVSLALRAGNRLGAAGHRVFWRGDRRTAAGLLERALALARPYRLDFHLEAELVAALYPSDVVRAVAVADAAAERAVAAGDDVDVAFAHTVRALARLQSRLCSADELERIAREALPLLEAAEDDAGLVYVWHALAWAANMRQRFEDWALAAEATIRYARQAGTPHPGPFSQMLAVPLAVGPRPAREALATLDDLLADHPEPGTLLVRALLLAMLDRLDEAWAVALPAEERFREFGISTGGEWLAEIALIAGDYEAAAAYLLNACDALEASGNRGELSTYAALLGWVLCKLGCNDEAEIRARQGRELGDSEDVMTQHVWRQAQALVHSARGVHEEAERLAREAVDWSRRSDSPLSHGNALVDLAEVLDAAGRREEAANALREAVHRYERKPIIPLARRTRERLAALQAPIA